MIKYALVLALFLCATAQADVVGTLAHSNGVYSILLHNVQGECAEGLLQAQVVDKSSTVVGKGCWLELDDNIGILWEGERAPRVGPRKLFTWIST